MGYISALFAMRVADVASGDGSSKDARRRALCTSAGIDVDAPPDPSRVIRDATFFDLLEHIAEEFEDGRSIGVRVGETMRCDDYGAFGLAFKSAVDLLGSFRRVERYGKVVTSIANYTVEPGDGSAFMALCPDAETRLGLTITRELAIAAATALSREVSARDFVPKAVCFAHGPPADLSPHAAHFRCPIYYGANRDGLEISDELLRAGNRLGDARISEFFDAHLEKELLQFADEDRLDEQVRVQVTQALSDGVPRISDIANRLGMSGRTLQRRLSEQGHIYQGLVDTARRDLAERLLGRTDFSLAEIAFLTGYADQSAFTRAFKRWHGQTPASFRRDVTTN